MYLHYVNTVYCGSTDYCIWYPFRENVLSHIPSLTIVKVSLFYPIWHLISLINGPEAKRLLTLVTDCKHVSITCACQSRHRAARRMVCIIPPCCQQSRNHHQHNINIHFSGETKPKGVTSGRFLFCLLWFSYKTELGLFKSNILFN